MPFDPETAWPRAGGEPPIGARLRCAPEDFRVDEELGFAPDGDGQHVLARVWKRGANTDWVARHLAALAGVASRDVSFAGLKDRHAVTTQWFSIDLKGKAEPDWADADSEEMRVLETHRHRRKLRRGALSGNRFELVLREVAGDRERLAERLPRIGDGVPNYFGEQRFGRGFGNIEQARLLLAGKLGRIDRNRRGLYLSAARSLLFNTVLAVRVENGTWNRALGGEALMLSGSRARFIAASGDSAIPERIASGDVVPTGPLWGRGEPSCRGEARELELAALSGYGQWCAGLEKAGLEGDRRSLVLPVSDFRYEWASDDALRVAFRLPAGGYATTVLREIARFE